MGTQRVGARLADESGQVMLLSIAYAVLVLLLVTATVSATSVHLERKALLALADTAALAGATALDEAAYYSRPGDGTDPVVLTGRSVRAAVQEHVAAASPEGLTDLSVVAAHSPDGRTAEVTLSALAHPPLLSWVTAAWSDGIHLQVTARARAG